MDERDFQCEIASIHARAVYQAAEATWTAASCIPGGACCRRVGASGGLQRLVYPWRLVRHASPPTGRRILIQAFRRTAANTRARLTESTVVLTTIVAVAFCVYSALSVKVVAPRIFDDELIYPDAAASLTQGMGLTVRGHAYGWSLVYPLILAAILLVIPNRVTAYALWKMANAFFFALAAVPVYLLARRVVSPRASLLVAFLAVAIPSSTYISTIQTEGLAYPVASWTIYAIVRALERPTPARQLGVAFASLVAIGVRPQFVALYAAYVAGLALMSVICPPTHATRRPSRPFAPAWIPILAGGLIVGGLFAVRGSLPTSAFSSYSVLWHGYNPVQVGKWLVWHAADLELYMGLMPAVVTPAALWILVRRARTGSAPHGALGGSSETLKPCIHTAFRLAPPVDYPKIRHVLPHFLAFASRA